MIGAHTSEPGLKFIPRAETIFEQAHNNQA